MKVILKQANKDEGLLIPKEYLPDASEFELEVTGQEIVVRPKPEESDRKKGWPYDWIGIAEFDNPHLSEEVEEILMREIDQRSGWTTKPRLEDEPKDET